MKSYVLFIFPAFETRRKPVAHQFVENCTRANGVSREVTQSQQYYNQVDSKDELRKLVRHILI